MKPKKLIYLALTLVLLGGVCLTACGSQAPARIIDKPVVMPAATAVPQYTLNVFSPESPTTFNIHLSGAVKDREPARIIYEPLAVFDKDGRLVPVLAAEIPSLENGQVDADGKSVTWKLLPNVLWSDGKPFTAHDVEFTYSYIMDPDVNSSSKSSYTQVAQVEALDDFTVKVSFVDPTPAWDVPFVGSTGVIIPEHIFSAYIYANASEAREVMPVGTGPYQALEPGIKPQEVLLLGSQIVKTTKIVFEPNPNYRFKDKIFFHRIIWRGGGTADEGARLLLQEGSSDLVYNLDSVEPDKLTDLLQSSSKGQIVSALGAGVLRVILNRTDPKHPSADGEYSSIQVPHPFLSDEKVRQAIAYAIDREQIAQLYDTGDQPAYANLIAPPRYRSPNAFYEYDPKKANELLDEAGYLYTDGDKFREKGSVKLKLVFQGFTNTIVQQAQKIIQKDLNAIGFDVEIPSTPSSIMFGADKSNPDNAWRFNADMMIFQYRSSSPDPSSYMQSWACSSIPQASNNWSGFNFERWCNAEYDALLQQAKNELDPVVRQQMFIQLNDMLVKDVVMIPVVWRTSAIGVSQTLTGIDATPWDTITWNIQEWRFTAP